MKKRKSIFILNQGRDKADVVLGCEGSNQRSPLVLAVVYNATKTLRLFLSWLEAKSYSTTDVLIGVLESRGLHQLEAFNFLLESSGNVDKQAVFLAAVKAQKMEVVKKILPEVDLAKNNNEALTCAVEGVWVEGVELLLKESDVWKRLTDRDLTVPRKKVFSMYCNRYIEVQDPMTDSERKKIRTLLVNAKDRQSQLASRSVITAL